MSWEHPQETWEFGERSAFCPEDFRFYQWLTAAELLDLHGRLSGVPATELRERLPAFSRSCWPDAAPRQARAGFFQGHASADRIGSGIDS